MDNQQASQKSDDITSSGVSADEVDDARPAPDDAVEQSFGQSDLDEKAARETKVMSVWREASRLFSGLRYGLSSPIDGWRQSRRQFGDTITSSHQLKYWKKLRALTDTLDDTELDYLRAMAHQRVDFSAAVFRMNAVTSITIPISTAVVANQLYPGVVQKWLEEDTGFVIALALVLLFLLGAVFGNVFKARELRMALDLEAARRRLHRGELGEPLASDPQEFDLQLPTT